MSKIPAYIIGNDIKEISLNIAEMTDAEKSIVEAGSLINYNKSKIK
jgi:aconitate hydratase (fragment)